MTKQPAFTSKRPFRDAVMVYAAFTVLFIVVTFGTGGNMLVAVPVAIGCFLIATAYSWWRIRQKLEAERLDAERQDS